MAASDNPRERAQVLALLAAGAAGCSAAAKADVLLLTNRKGTVSCAARTLEDLVSQGLICRTGASVVLAEPAKPPPALKAGPDDRFANQHRQLETGTVTVDGTLQPVSVNLSESPLGTLMRRKGPDGLPYLRDEEFAAGERLRSDYTRGHIMPRLGANWEASVASGGRRQGNATADLTATALAARQRVDKAVAAVGPELSGILIDVCCFLKGLERVEQERSWPVRSGKLLLKTALASLARHYAPPASARRSSPIHWGSDDYRPSIR